jgi:hypothetical protein
MTPDNRPDPELFLDDHRGIYIPRDFAECIDARYWFGITSEELGILADPDHDLYWEVWSAVCDNALAFLPEPGHGHFVGATLATLGAAHVADTAGDTAERDRLLAMLKLESLIDERCPATAAHVQRMYSTPYRNRDWRRSVILHAIDRALGTHGVESLGPVDDEHGPPFLYCNAGDTYAATLIYDRDADELTIGCWGDALEAYEREAVPEAWDQHGYDEFTSALSNVLDRADPDHDHDATELDNDVVGKLWRDGCSELQVDEYIEESGGYYFPVDLWTRRARTRCGANRAFGAQLVALAMKCRTPE